MKKKNLKHLTFNKETISKINPNIITGGAIEVNTVDLPATATTRVPLTVTEPKKPFTEKYSNCASFCFECQ